MSNKNLPYIICIVFFNVYVLDLYISVYNMCCPCMIATIPLPTKPNCFISAWEMLTIIWDCALVLFFVDDFYNLINHLPKEKKIINHER